LEVVGLDDDKKEVVRHAVQSSQHPAAIQAKVIGDKEIKSGAMVQIALQIVDENNEPVILSEDEVTCNLVGNARLLGMEAGNNADMADYTDNKQRVYHGKMLVYVQALAQPGETINIRFTSPWLKTATVQCVVK